MNFDVERALLWIVLLPLAGAIINGLFGRFATKRVAGMVGVGTVAGSFVLAVLAFIELATRGGEGAVPQPITQEVYEWFTLSIGGRDVPIRVAFVMDTLSGVMTLVVTGIGLLIHLYSLEYMEEDRGFARFFTYLNLFITAMLVQIGRAHV